MIVRTRDPYRLSHTTKPGRANPFKGDNTRLMRETWADFCINHCPHPRAVCDHGGTCPEFRAKFGERKDT